MNILYNKTLNLVVIFTLDSVKGYIHMVTDILTSPKSNVKYFNVKFQDGSNVKRGVSYDLAQHTILKQFESSKAAVSMTNIKVKRNLFTDNEEIQLTKKTKIEATETNFKFKDTTSKVTIQQLNAKKDNFLSTLVDVEGFVEIENAQSKFMPTKFFREPVELKEVHFNDSTGSIKLELWGLNIEKIASSGTFSIKNLRVKEFPQTVLRLSTVRDTIIQISDAKIEPAVQPEASNEENILSTVKFPIQSVEAVYDHHVCPKCKTVASVIHSDLLFKCNQCNARARCDKVKKTFLSCVSLSWLMAKN